MCYACMMNNLKASRQPARSLRAQGGPAGPSRTAHACSCKRLRCAPLHCQITISGPHRRQGIEAAGAAYLEAPVSGSKGPAEAGQLVFLAGGERALFDRAAPALDVMGKASFYLGPVRAPSRLDRAGTRTLPLRIKPTFGNEVRMD